MEPGHLIGLRVCLHNALEVCVVALLYVIRIQRGANLQHGRGRVCMHIERKRQKKERFFYSQLGFTRSVSR